MTATPRGALYSPQLLGLAVELAAYPFDATAPLIGEARSRSCGSSIAISTAPSFAPLGMRVQACAVGQAAAAIFARHAGDKSTDEIAATLTGMEAWLAGTGPLPDWPDLQKIEVAHAYPGRHGAIVLPWRAALDALSKDEAGR